MARLTDSTREKILADFHIGKSQNWLAREYECSPATINKLCKGVVSKFKDKVNTVVAIKTELNSESEYQSECFDKEVNDLLRRKNLVYGGVEKAVKKMNDIIASGYVEDKINVGDGMQKFENRALNTSDVKNAIDGLDRASITLGVSDRHSNQNINLNTQNNQSTLQRTINVNPTKTLINAN